MATPYQIQQFFNHEQVVLPPKATALRFVGRAAAPIVFAQLVAINQDGELEPASATDGQVVGAKVGNSFSGAGDETEVMLSGIISQDDWTNVAGVTDLEAGKSYFLHNAGQMRSFIPTEQDWVIRVGEALNTREFFLHVTVRVAPSPL